MRPSRIAATVLACAVVLSTAGPAVADDTARLLNAADVPSALGASSDARTHVIPGVPTQRRLQLCDTLAGRWQTQIAGPRTMTQVLVVTDADRPTAVQELVYQYPSVAAAEQAWERLRTSATRCDRVVHTGSAKTVVRNGVFPGVTARPDVWVSHADTVRGDADASFTVFAQGGDAIIATMLVDAGTSDITAKRRTAVRDLAQRLAERWETTAQ